MNNVHLINPVYDMDSYKFRINMFTKQARVCVSVSRVLFSVGVCVCVCVCVCV